MMQKIFSLSIVAFSMLLAAAITTPAHAADYSFDAPDAGLFGAPTSNETIYVGTSNTSSSDISKNSALIPPGFGTPTSNLPGSGVLLTPNLAGSGTAGTVGNSPTAGGGLTSYPTSSTSTATQKPTYTSTLFTPVTSDFYYSAGHIGTLKIPAIGLSVKVYQGTESAQLAKGAGHFTNTSFWDGNTCLAAHNRGVTNTFGQIHTLDIGDKITLTTLNGTRTYYVTDVYKVNETDTSMLAATSDNCITLITCVSNQSEYRWCVRAAER